ncbi:MAG: hypothetical protein ACRCT2_01865 [Plesiomonas shigelloides]
MDLNWPDFVPLSVRVDREKLVDEILILERKIDSANGAGTTRVRIKTWLDRKNLSDSLLEVENSILVKLRDSMAGVLRGLKPSSCEYDRPWFLNRVAILRDELNKVKGDRFGDSYVQHWIGVFVRPALYTNGLPLRYLMALSDALEGQMGEAFKPETLPASNKKSRKRVMVPPVAQGRKTAIPALPLGDW